MKKRKSERKRIHRFVESVSKCEFCEIWKVVDRMVEKAAKMNFCERAWESIYW